MRTTLDIDDEILKTASELTGVKKKTALVRLGLQALIAKESGKRLANLGGTEKGLRGFPEEGWPGIRYDPTARVSSRRESKSRTKGISDGTVTRPAPW